MKFGIFLFFISMAIFSITNNEWITYTSVNNDYRIKFPGNPFVKDIEPNFEMNEIKTISYMQIDSLNSHANSYAYNLTIMNLSENILKPGASQNEKNEILIRYSSPSIILIGEILSTKEIFLSSFPGIYLDGRINVGITNGSYPLVIVKSFLAENKIYELKIYCPPGKKDDSNVNFFDSFKLIQN